MSDSHLPFWNQPEASSEVFVRIDGKRFLRTGDLACVDQGGCFKVTEREITDWSHGNMAADEVPRIVEFVGTLPKSGAGKVMWRSCRRRRRRQRRRVRRRYEAAELSTNLAPAQRCLFRRLRLVSRKQDRVGHRLRTPYEAAHTGPAAQP